MSATAAVRPRPAARPTPRRRLRALDRPAQDAKPRLLYGAIAVASAMAIIGAQMILGVMTTQSSYELAHLSQQQRQLTYQKQILGDEVAGLGSPQYLAANAAALGMVIDQSPSYLTLSTGKVAGPAEQAPWASTVNPIGNGAVPNSLLDHAALATAPGSTVRGPRKSTATTHSPTPPPVTDGLPTVSTH